MEVDTNSTQDPKEQIDDSNLKVDSSLPQSSEEIVKALPPTTERCERTFITFSDEATFKKAFPEKKGTRLKESKICPITRYVILYKNKLLFVFIDLFISTTMPSLVLDLLESHHLATLPILLYC